MPNDTSPVSLTDIKQRPRVAGKFISVGDKKLWVKGVSYGAFQPDANKREYQNLEKIDRDFAQMATAGFNTVRIPHTMPPRELLDIAQRNGLWVMVGLSAEQYAGFLIDTDKEAPDVLDLVRSKVRSVAGHPALLCYAVGNEIPAALVRWIGRKPVERYIERVYRAIKQEDPDGLVTYVNYPTTEYLQLPFLDLLAFNVYLESKDRLEAYLARLQNIAGERPLLMSELGLDSLRNGEEAQAASLDWQVRTAFAEACAGVVIFSWTDEWFRGDAEVEDWAFGLTTKERCPKLALKAVGRAFAEIPLPPDFCFPRISVVVCSFNGESTIRDTLSGLLQLDYPDFEVIVVDDGSTDNTAQIASEYRVRLIKTENRGLSSARNTGWQASSGEIVAYIDDDAYPDPHWLQYVAYAFSRGDFVGIGGPNIAPPGDGLIAECVANAPGGPVHVLLSDREAEHIAGCNMAFRRSVLEAVDGFDPVFRAAGDDVDICWRLQRRGWKLGFSAGAMTWLHRRNSVRAYWKQQSGYGKAEALLEAKWPEKYNVFGHPTWAGRLYGSGLAAALLRRQHVYGGTMGNAPFQSLYERNPPTLFSLASMPEWYFLIAGLALLSLAGLFWTPLLWALVPMAIAIVAPLVQAAMGAARARYHKSFSVSRGVRMKRWLLTMMLHLSQPLARLSGRLRHGLTPWRRRGDAKMVLPLPTGIAQWTEHWAPPESRSKSVVDLLKNAGHVPIYGSEFDRWDLEVRGGCFGGARMLMAVEDHGGGAQYIRVRMWPRICAFPIVIALFSAILSVLAALDGAWVATGLFGAMTAAVLLWSGREIAFSMGALAQAADGFERSISNECHD